jgi:hypothetical protein
MFRASGFIQLSFQELDLDFGDVCSIFGVFSPYVGVLVPVENWWKVGMDFGFWIFAGWEYCASRLGASVKDQRLKSTSVNQTACDRAW